MKWFKRGLWLFAWSVWLWLGFGLYRELPRELGKPVLRVTRNVGDQIIGFVDERPIVATFELSKNEGHFVELLDVKTGAVSKIEGARKLVRSSFAKRPRRNDFVIAQTVSDYGGRGRGQKSSSSVFDLTARRRLDLFTFAGTPVVHPVKPWAIFIESWTFRDNGPPGVGTIVYDLKSGTPILDQTSLYRAGDRTVERNSSQLRTPFFLGEDSIALPVPAEKLGQADDLEIRRLPQDDRPPRRIKGVGVGNSVVTYGDRIAWNDIVGGRPSTLVFDAKKETIIFSTPWTGAMGAEEEKKTPTFSEDGAVLFVPQVKKLFAVDSGAVRWNPRAHETIVAADGGFFEVQEDWRFAVYGWNTYFQSFALRRFRDGSLVQRTWESTPIAFAKDDGGRQFVLLKDEVHVMPLSGNWRLLFFCQTLLALPLILLWAILRYRRRRAARRQPAVAIPSMVTP